MAEEKMKTNRIQELDLIRILFAFLGIFFHIALCFNLKSFPYSWTVGYWLPGLGNTVYFLHLFRLHIFFIISGLFVDYRSTKGFWELWRSNRVIVYSILFFGAIVLPAIFVLFGQPPFGRSPDYLWFLIYLLVFRLIDFVISAFYSKVYHLFPKNLRLAGPLLIMISILSVSLAIYLIPATLDQSPSYHWMPQIKTALVYWIFYFTGALISSRVFIQTIKSLDQFKLFIILTLTVSGFLFIRNYSEVTDFLQGLAKAALPWIVLIYTTKAAIFFQKFFDLKSSQFYKFSYLRIYLLHKPILLLTIYYLDQFGVRTWHLFFSTIIITVSLIVVIETYFLRHAKD